MASQLETSVVICTYSQDRKPSLLRAVASARNQLLRPREIIVVVDQDKDLAYTLPMSLPSDVTLVFNAEPSGLSGARNTGVQQSRGQVVAFLDDDAWAEPDWLTSLTAGFQQPGVFGVGGRVIPIWPEAGRPSWFPEELDWVVGCSYAGFPVSADQRVRNVIGCNMAFRKSVFEGVGYFRNSLGRVGKTTGQAEETDLCLRIARGFPGAIIRYEPRATVYHDVAIDRATLHFLLVRSYNEGYWKGHLRRLQAGDANGVLSSESHYLRHLLAHFLPRRLSHIYRMQNLVQLAATSLSVLTVGVGYLAATLLPGRSDRRAASPDLR
jgi:GT2 family glycosyltransferase